MHVTPRQAEEIRGAFETLLRRIAMLRDEEGFAAPSDDCLELLFTDPEAYVDLAEDATVAETLAMLRGIAIGLAGPSILDLYAHARSCGAASDDLAERHCEA